MCCGVGGADLGRARENSRSKENRWKPRQGAPVPQRYRSLPPGSGAPSAPGLALVLLSPVSATPAVSGGDRGVPAARDRGHSRDVGQAPDAAPLPQKPTSKLCLAINKAAADLGDESVGRCLCVMSPRVFPQACQISASSDLPMTAGARACQTAPAQPRQRREKPRAEAGRIYGGFSPACSAAHTIHRCLWRMTETVAAWHGTGIFRCYCTISGLR